MKHLPAVSRPVRLLLYLALTLVLAALWAILAQPSFTPQMAMERAIVYYHFGPGTVLRSDQVPPPPETDPQVLGYHFDEDTHYFLLRDEEWLTLVLCGRNGFLWDWGTPTFWQPDPEAAVSCVETGRFLVGTVQDPRVARITARYDLDSRTFENDLSRQLPRFAETRDLAQGVFCLTLQYRSLLENITIRAYDADGSLLWEGAPVNA